MRTGELVFGIAERPMHDVRADREGEEKDGKGSRPELERAWKRRDPSEEREELRGEGVHQRGAMRDVHINGGDGLGAAHDRDIFPDAREEADEKEGARA